VVVVVNRSWSHSSPDIEIRQLVIEIIYSMFRNPNPEALIGWPGAIPASVAASGAG